MKFTFEPQASAYSPENAYRLAVAAQLAYESGATVESTVRGWGFATVTFVSHGSTQCFVAGRSDLVLVVFRGTEPTSFADWLTDAQVAHEDHPLGGSVHHGFDHAWKQVRSAVWAAAGASAGTAAAPPLWLAGHSLGAALAVLAAADRLATGAAVQGLYTYGQPRTGSRRFARLLYAGLGSGRYFRFVNNNDIVTRIPPGVMGYCHTGALRYFDADGTLHGDASRWTRLADRVRGRLEAALEPGTDGVHDHAIGRYVKLLESRPPVV